MPHSPPIPPANQSPYPLAEAPHDHHEPAKPKPAAPKHPPHHDNRVRNGVAAALGIGAIAALIAGLVAVARQPDRPAPRRKDGPRKKK